MEAIEKRQDVGRAAWFSLPKPRHDARLRLFCFPCAGGDSTFFREWSSSLPEEVELIPVLLPGRGARADEKPLTDMGRLIKSLATRILFYADKPFALLGHSLGATICFELARFLEADYGLGAAHLFLLACQPPHLPNAALDDTLRESADPVAAACRLGLITEEAARNAELMSYAAERLGADYSLYRSYDRKQRQPLSSPITVYGASGDQLAAANSLAEWQKCTTARLRIEIFDGGHFFIKTAERQLLAMLACHLRQVLSHLD